MNKIWEIYGDAPDSNDNPEKILNEYASRLENDTDGKFVGLVTETIREDTASATYALYLIVPELNSYMYRLIEVNIQDLATWYPLELRLFAKDPKNHKSFYAQDAKDYRSKLEELIKSPATKAILMRLKVLVDIKKEYNNVKETE